jgi:hypothetical protein
LLARLNFDGAEHRAVLRQGCGGDRSFLPSYHEKNDTKTKWISIPHPAGTRRQTSVLVIDLTGQARPQKAPIAEHGSSTGDEYFSSLGAANRGHGG